jgi:hypothetical protein
LVAEISTSATNNGHVITSRNVFRVKQDQVAAATVNPMLPAAVDITPLSTQAGTVDLEPEELSRAVQAFLADHGDLCLAMYTWPRDVTSEDQQANSHEALQLPVLERLGVVRSVEVPVPAAGETALPAGPAKRYSLTEKGRAYYLRKKRITLDVHTQPEEHEADFCVARLTLDKVVKWSPPEPIHNHLETVVKYTYHIKSADWLADASAREVFPIVDRIVRGQGTLLMSATVQLQDGRWIPVLPGQ